MPPLIIIIRRRIDSKMPPLYIGGLVHRDDRGNGRRWGGGIRLHYAQQPVGQYFKARTRTRTLVAAPQDLVPSCSTFYIRPQDFKLRSQGVIRVSNICTLCTTPDTSRIPLRKAGILQTTLGSVEAEELCDLQMPLSRCQCKWSHTITCLRE